MRSNLKGLVILALSLLVFALFMNAKKSSVVVEPVQVYSNNDTLIHRIYRIDLTAKSLQTIVLPAHASSLVAEWISLPKENAFVEMPDGTQYDIEKPGSDNGSDRMFSRLIIPNDSFNSFSISGAKNDSVLIHVLFVPEIDSIPDSNKRLNKKSDSYCKKPTWTSFETWRKGLPEPIKGRLSTDVQHLVIHHSAVQSNDTDYVKRVRNIYTFHTQTRGWDDIGYNFLIAPNGVLFAGRDPDGVADQDNILGAHYCAKNTGTMGVCMMGDYSSDLLSNVSREKLKHLLVWKLYKSALSTYDTFRHPANVGDFLYTVAGHRNGCATACPGNGIYSSLSTLRDEVQLVLNQCVIASTIQLGRQRPFAIWPNPTSDYLHVNIADPNRHRIKITNLSGQELNDFEIDRLGRINIKELAMGIYWLEIENKGRIKFVVFNQ
jgi:hypothetical protein